MGFSTSFAHLSANFGNFREKDEKMKEKRSKSLGKALRAVPSKILTHDSCKWSKRLQVVWVQRCLLHSAGARASTASALAPPHFLTQFQLMAGFFGRRRNTPENSTRPKNAGNWRSRESAFSGVLRFRVCFGAEIGEQRALEKATHPKTQLLGTVHYLRFWVGRVFGCFGPLWGLAMPESLFKSWLSLVSPRVNILALSWQLS